MIPQRAEEVSGAAPSLRTRGAAEVDLSYSSSEQLFFAPNANAPESISSPL